LKINEWMASPSSGDDWFEIYNPDPLPVALSSLYLTDDSLNPTNTRIAALTYIGGGGFVQFQADENPENGSDHTDFKLGATGDSIGLYASNGSSSIDSISFGPQPSDVSQGRFPDGSAAIISFPATPSPGRSNHLPLTNIVIHEVLSHTDPPLEDAVELFNPTTSAVNVGGWYLSDELDLLKKYRIPDNTVIPAGGYRVFYEYQFNANTNLPTSFSFSSARGDDVYLSEADGAGNLTSYRTHVDFGASENGISFGRFATSDGVDFTALNSRTFGADNPATVAAFRLGSGLPNAVPKVGPVVISEIMYHPPDLGTNDNTRDEFIELHNLLGAPMPLFDPLHRTNTWRLRGTADFDFPTNVTLPERGFVVVVSFDPLTNATALAAFRSKYGAGITPLGPYQSKLDNGGGSVELYKPDPPQTIPGPDLGLVPYILVDRVRYSDHAPWLTAPDGAGPSLQRVDVATYGNEPTNWFASGYTPGASYIGNEPPLVSVTNPTDGTFYVAPANVPIGATASDSDGSITKVEFFADGTEIGESATAPYGFVWTNPPVGTHLLVARATDNQSATSDSPPITIVVGSTAGDSDNDGMSDAWEAANNLIVGVDDSALDPDGDGMTNLQEFLAGTNPNNPTSVLRLNAVENGANVLLSFTAQANRAYTVQFRTNLVTGTWQTYSNVSPPTVSQIIQMSESTGSGIQRWYRVATPTGP
jgi:hypothetical protein